MRFLCAFSGGNSVCMMMYWRGLCPAQQRVTRLLSRSYPTPSLTHLLSHPTHGIPLPLLLLTHSLFLNIASSLFNHSFFVLECHLTHSLTRSSTTWNTASSLITHSLFWNTTSSYYSLILWVEYRLIYHYSLILCKELKYDIFMNIN